MKKSFKKLMPITMAGIMIFGSIAPIFAVVKETETVTSNSTQQTEVIYNQESSFEVIVPKLVDLGSDKFTNYEVTVSGDISSDEVVKVVPDESFFMKDKSGTTNFKEDVEAIVTQDKTEWIFNEFETKANGNISAPSLTAGSWEGSFFFNIKLDKASAEEAVTLEAGLYDADGNMLCTWEESGIDVEANYTYSDYKTETASPYYIITNNYPTTTTVVIPEGTTSIGTCAFYCCRSLTNITIPESVTSIGNDAFYNCYSLMSVNIPEGVTAINDYTFYCCRSLTNITIPESVTKIGRSAFWACRQLTSIKIPASVTSIDNTAFVDCSSLTSIIVDKNNTKFDSRNNCNAIITTKVNVIYVGCQNTIIPDSITTIGQSAFYGRTGLTNIIIPEGVTTIYSYAFYKCTNLTEIVMPNSITKIETKAFQLCTELTSITIPKNVTKIGKNAFFDCESLTSITWNGIIYTDKEEFNQAIKDAGIATEDVWN